MIDDEVAVGSLAATGGRFDLAVGRGDSSMRVMGKKPATLARVAEFIAKTQAMVRGEEVTVCLVQHQARAAGGGQIAVADPAVDLIAGDWVQRQVPAVAQRIDIASKVEQKILEFPTTQVEDLIKGVTERELQLIVRLGYVLGAMIGLGSALLSWVF